MTPFALPRQVTVLGLGLFGGGVGAARFFAERGVRVIVSDSRAPEALAESVAALEGLPIEFRLGAHREDDFAGSDLIVVNPGVPDDSPGFKMARASGARLDTEINLLFRLSPAPIAAVTGTNGKSTTVALLGDMMRAAGRRTWVGGNLGGSLLSDVDSMRPEHIIVLEISSFQSERLAWAGLSPHLGMVLNITPNHLDRHRDMAEYAAAKRQILLNQQPGDFALLNAADPLLKTWTDAGCGRKFFIGADESQPMGARLIENGVRLWRDRTHTDISFDRLRIPGAHNRFNAACAAAAAWLLGAAPDAVESALASFNGLPDRIEFVAERNGVRFYNDSIATTPESTIVALDAFDSGIILIAGGSSKNLSYEQVGRAVARRAKSVVLIGVTAAEIERAVRNAADDPPSIHHAAGLDEAVSKAAACARPGDVVLLSPASASFDMFRNYAERGDRFRRIVNSL
jgi:UDP-N-acetylmuramoylalanine--D-glutamate ligase